MRSESEQLTRAYLRRRREERRHHRITNRLVNTGCLMGAMACMAYLLYLEWPVLMMLAAK